MKKILTIFLIMAMIASFSACGDSAPSQNSNNKPDNNPVSEAEPVEEAVEPLDLSGQYVQDISDPTHMVAQIEDDVISVFFILEDDSTPWTYWVGTYEAPLDNPDSYKWNSKNIYTGNGLMASGAEEKEFTYKDGKLSFELTIQGDTGTITMTPNEWDNSEVPKELIGASASALANPDIEELQIVDSGYYVSSGGYLYYYVKLYNPNTDLAIEFPKVRITARDKENVLLGTEDCTFNVINPGQYLVHAFLGFAVDEEPETVEFEIGEPVTEYDVKIPDELKELEVVNYALRSDKIVGEVKNPNDASISMVSLTVIAKDSDGNLVFADSTFVDDVAANGNTPFEMRTGSKDINSCDISMYAVPWD